MPRFRPRRTLIVLLSVVVLAILFYTGVNWRGADAWREHGAALRAKVGPHAVFDLPPTAIPDDENFALHPIVQAILREQNVPGLPALESSLSLDDQPLHKWALDLQEQLKGGAAGAVDLTAADRLLEVLRPFEAALADLRNEARNRPRGQTLRSWEVSWSRIPYGQLFELARIFGTHATASLATGDSAAAAEDGRAMLRLAETIASNDSILGVLLALAISQQAVGVVEAGKHLDGWTPGQMEVFQAGLGAIAFPATFQRALNRERLHVTGWIAQDPSRGRFPSSPESNLIMTLAQNLPRGWLYRAAISTDNAMLELQAAGFGSAPPGIDRQRLAGFSRSLHAQGKSWNPAQRMAATVMTSFEPILLNAAEEMNELALVQVALALERHRLANGSLPASLPTLAPPSGRVLPTDIYSGQPFRYSRLTPTTFLLYSVGPDGKDDGGDKSRDITWSRW